MNTHHQNVRKFTEIRIGEELNVKGTWKRNLEAWDAKKYNDSGNYIFAALCCPGCGRQIGVGHRTHKIERNGTITPSFICPHAVPDDKKILSCDFHEYIQLKGWMPLYAVAVERKKGEDWVPEIFYVHATDAFDAKYQHLKAKEHKEDRLVGVSIVIGVEADEKGNRPTL